MSWKLAKLRGTVPCQRPSPGMWSALPRPLDSLPDTRPQPSTSSVYKLPDHFLKAYHDTSMGRLSPEWCCLAAAAVLFNALWRCCAHSHACMHCFVSFPVCTPRCVLPVVVLVLLLGSFCKQPGHY